MKYLTAILILLALPACAQESQSDYYRRAIEPYAGANAQSDFQRSYEMQKQQDEVQRTEQQSDIDSAYAPAKSDETPTPAALNLGY